MEQSGVQTEVEVQGRQFGRSSRELELSRDYLGLEKNKTEWKRYYATLSPDDAMLAMRGYVDELIQR